MQHIAIMRKSWGLTKKILTKEKTVESRWYKCKRAPWNKVKKDDIIYFKDSNEPVSIKARVTKVLQFKDLDKLKTEQILNEHAKQDLGIGKITPEIKEYISNKNYCILVFFDNIEKIKPFEINKNGFGAMCSWICVKDTEKIKLH